MNNTETLKAEVAGYMKRLYDKGLITCSGGNISLKIDVTQFLVTPSGKDKGNLQGCDICICDAEGN